MNNKSSVTVMYIALIVMLVGVIFMDIIDDGVPSYSMSAIQNLYVLIFA